MSEQTYTDDYGVEIVYDVYRPEGEPRAAVQILHGVGEHAGRYAALIEALTAEGYVVYADDHRGHGRTGMRQHGGDRSKLGKLGKGGHRAAVGAVYKLTQIIRAENPGLALIIIGHSWGSFLTQILLNQHPRAYDAVILSGSSLRWPGALNAGDLNKPWKSATAAGTEWLAADLSVGEAFTADPLTTSTPLMKLFGPVEAARIFGKPAKNLPKDVPVLLMVGRDDTVGGPRSVHMLANAYRDRSGLTDVTTLVYPEGRHEIFNEANQAEVRADLIDWLDARFPRGEDQ